MVPFLARFMLKVQELEPNLKNELGVGSYHFSSFVSVAM